MFKDRAGRIKPAWAYELHFVLAAAAAAGNSSGTVLSCFQPILQWPAPYRQADADSAKEAVPEVSLHCPALASSVVCTLPGGAAHSPLLAASPGTRGRLMAMDRVPWPPVSAPGASGYTSVLGRLATLHNVLFIFVQPWLAHY